MQHIYYTPEQRKRLDEAIERLKPLNDKIGALPPAPKLPAEFHMTQGEFARVRVKALIDRCMR